MCAVSYDTVETLRDFSRRHDIRYPLLSDERSDVIRAFGILNDTLSTDHKHYGIPHPGTFVVDSERRIVQKFFHEEFHTRDTPAAILQRLAPEVESVALQEVVESDVLSARFWLPQRELSHLQVTHLTVDIAIRREFHVYAPPVSSEYTPLTLRAEGKGIRVGDVSYPAPKIETLSMQPLGETLPIFSGRLRLRAPLTMEAKTPSTLSLALEFQACDQRTCFPPSELNTEMTIDFKSYAQ